MDPPPRPRTATPAASTPRERSEGTGCGEPAAGGKWTGPDALGRHASRSILRVKGARGRGRGTGRRACGGLEEVDLPRQPSAARQPVHSALKERGDGGRGTGAAGVRRTEVDRPGRPQTARQPVHSARKERGDGGRGTGRGTGAAIMRREEVDRPRRPQTARQPVHLARRADGGEGTGAHGGGDHAAGRKWTRPDALRRHARRSTHLARKQRRGRGEDGVRGWGTRGQGRGGRAMGGSGPAPTPSDGTPAGHSADTRRGDEAASLRKEEVDRLGCCPASSQPVQSSPPHAHAADERLDGVPASGRHRSRCKSTRALRRGRRRG